MAAQHSGADMQRLIGNLQQNQFLVVGRAGVDFYPDPPGTKIEDAVNFVAHLGGSSANAAVALAKQGCSCSLLTTLSDDAVGRLAVRQLNLYGVDTSLVKTATDDRDARTSLAVVESTVSNPQSIIYRNRAADLQVDTEGVWDVLGEATTLSPRFTTLCVSGTNLVREPARSATLMALRLARQKKITTVMDIDYRPYSWRSSAEAAKIYQRAVALCDIVIGNEAEFAVIQGGEVLTEGGVAEAAGEENVKSGMRFAKGLVSDQDRGEGQGGGNARLCGSSLLTIYKMGKAGSVAFFRTRDAEALGCGGWSENLKGSKKYNFKVDGDVLRLAQGIFSVEALKPVGAGDAFIGGFLSGLAFKQPLPNAIMRGSASAAIVVSKVGCAPAMPTKTQLDSFMDQNDVNTPPLDD